MIDDIHGYKLLATEMCMMAAFDAITAKYIMTLDRNDPKLEGMPQEPEYYGIAKKVAPIVYDANVQLLKEKCELYSGLTFEAMMENAEKSWSKKDSRLDRWDFWDMDDKKEYHFARNTSIKTAEKMRQSLNQTRRSIYNYARYCADRYRITNNYIIADENKLIRQKGKEKEKRIMKLRELYKTVPDHKINKLIVECKKTDFETYCATATEEGESEELLTAYSDSWAGALMKLAAKMKALKEELDGYAQMLEQEFKRK